MTFTSLAHNYRVVLILHVSTHNFFASKLWTKDDRKIDLKIPEFPDLAWNRIVILAMQRMLKIMDIITDFGG